MDKQTLAQELRWKQYAYGMLSQNQIDAASDDEIIASYTTCSGCGKPTVSDVDLRLAIVTASTADEFLRFIASRHKH